MKTPPKKPQASDSSEQRSAEAEILAALERLWKVRLDGRPKIDQRVELDGFADGRVPICVEVWAHQGAAKGGQPAKVMRDFCKLLLVEKLLATKCRKVVAVCDETALALLDTSWQGRFADEFGIERVVVDVPEATRERIRKAQKRQYR
jgi:hypothetical protein